MNTKFSPNVEMANGIVSTCLDNGILHLSTQDARFSGKTMLVDGKKSIFWGNCSYLGLELDPRLKAAAIDAVDRYGACFSSSRAYINMGIYEELENLLSQIFGRPAIAVGSTTLGHLAVIPILMRKSDAIIMDHQVHASVQSAVGIAKSNGVHVEQIKHNNLDMLEHRIKALSETKDRIWYMFDSIYSMFGDPAPFEGLHDLLNRYDNLYLYADDAHGMSWAGKNGAGYVLSQFPEFHERLVLLTSHSKAFGAAGGSVVMPNKAWRDLVLNIGPSIMFSIQMPPASVGAMIASAKIHLTPEIEVRQERLLELINYYNLTARSLNLPLVMPSQTPIFFTGTGSFDAGLEIVKRMKKQGHILNLSSFPAVPYAKTGLRTTVTLHQSEQDIYDMLTALAANFEALERESKMDRTVIFRTFKERQTV